METVDHRKLANFVRKHLDRRLESEVEDVVQQTQIQAWRSHDQYRGDAKYSTWVHGIALNICRNMNTRFGPRLDLVIQVEELPEEMDFRTPFEAFEHKQVIAQIEQLVKNLPLHMRVVIELIAAGFSYEDTAEELNVPIGTIRSRVYRARETLKKEIVTC